VSEEVPSGWAKATVGALCDWPQYGWTTSASPGVVGPKLLRSTDISDGSVNWDAVPFCETPPPSIEKYQLHDGDIVITRTGAGVGNSFLVEGCPLAVFASYLIRFKPHPLINPRYFAYFLKSPSYWGVVSLRSAGIAQPNVNAQKLASIEVPLAPRKTQDAIVAEIEKQFTRLEAAVAALKRVQANLKRYRAAVLKAACEGRLVPTEAELARNEGRSYETGEQLLARTLEERRDKWEGDQLDKMHTSGKPPENDGWKRKYRKPEVPEPADLTVLPEGWTWATIDQVFVCLDGRRVPINKDERLRRGGDIPYYGANGQVGLIDDYIFNEPLVLVVEDETFVGRTVPFSYLIKGKSWVNNHAHVLRTTGTVSPEFLNYSLSFYPFTPLTTGSTGRRKLTQKALLQAPYPLPPIEEQVRIAAEVERMLSIGDEINHDLKRDIERADRLRQSILKRAFEGKLVPQDPNDEPASLLLERISEERTTRVVKKGNLRRQRQKTPAPTTVT
jgi:type I restriction enzyme S subunit